MVERSPRLRVRLTATPSSRSVADGLADDLRSVSSVELVGPAAPADVVVGVGGPPHNPSGEAWWLELVHSGVPSGSAFAALELADDVPLTGVELCACIDGRFYTLESAWLRTDPYSADRLRQRSFDAFRMLVVRGLRRRSAGSERPLRRSAPREVELSGSDRNRLRARRLHGFATTQLDETARSDHWAIGVVEAPISRFLAPNFRPEVIWSPDQGVEVFAADPFALSNAPDIRVAYERFDFRLGRGTIVARSYVHGGWGPEEELLELPSHLSYPFVWRAGETTYVVPENAGSGCVRAYEYLPGSLRRPKKILNFPCLDPTIFRYADLWWLFGTDARIGHVDVLHAWYSDVGPMGPWRPHALNPIAVDVRGSRPAGTPFRADGILYRPAQDGTSGYGRGVAINRVDLLTPSDFRETTVRRIAALGGRGGGIHTLSAAGESTLVDGKIRRVVPSTLGDRVGGRLRRMLGRDRG